MLGSVFKWSAIEVYDCGDIETTTVESWAARRERSLWKLCSAMRMVSAVVTQPEHARQSERDTVAIFFESGLSSSARLKRMRNYIEEEGRGDGEATW